MCIISASIATAISTALTAAVTAATSSAAATALSVTSAVAALGGTAMGVVGSVQQSKAQRAQANYQAQVAEQNKKIALKEAAEERQAGLENARNERIKALSAIGSQKTAMAANGMSIGEGSALDTIEDTAMMGELNALNTQYNAEQKALNYEQQAYNFQNEANLRRMEAINAKKAGTINAIGTGLNGIAKAASSVSGSWGTGSSGSSGSFGGAKSLGTTAEKFNSIYSA